jgi:hypothetical protein
MARIIKGVQTTIDIAATTTGDLIGDLSKGLLISVLGTSKGVEHILTGIGNEVNDLGEGIRIVTEHIAEGVGDVSRSVAEKLGNIIRIIPLVGNVSAYIVEDIVAKGIYYIVLSISDVIGVISKTVGTTVQKTSKVLVFTLASGRDVATTTVENANNTVKNILNNITKITKPKSYKKSSKGGSRKGNKKSKKKYRRRK